jgi:hypothetical protein
MAKAMRRTVLMSKRMTNGSDPTPYLGHLLAFGQVFTGASSDQPFLFVPSALVASRAESRFVIAATKPTSGHRRPLADSGLYAYCLGCPRDPETGGRTA